MELLGNQHQANLYIKLGRECLRKVIPKSLLSEIIDQEKEKLGLKAYTGWGKSRFTVHMENTTTINKKYCFAYSGL